MREKESERWRSRREVWHSHLSVRSGQKAQQTCPEFCNAVYQLELIIKGPMLGVKLQTTEFLASDPR